MSRELKKRMIQEYKAVFSGTENFVVVEFTGTDANEMTGIRRQLREASVKVRIVKNSLAKLAFDEEGLDQLPKAIDGPSALCFGAGDIIELAKAVNACARGASKFEIRGGYFDRRVVPIQDIRRLAAIPSRDALYAQVAGTLISPLARLAGAMNEMLARVARAVKALADQKQDAENT
jgi:large subunit ribosomal protein L10